MVFCSIFLDYNYPIVYYVDYNSISPLMTNKISILLHGTVYLLFAFILILFIAFNFEGSICCFIVVIIIIIIIIKNTIFRCKSELKFSQHGCTESKPSTTNFIIYPEIVTQNFFLRTFSSPLF
jgi:hypothetical protein